MCFEGLKSSLEVSIFFSFLFSLLVAINLLTSTVPIFKLLIFAVLSLLFATFLRFLCHSFVLFLSLNFVLFDAAFPLVLVLFLMLFFKKVYRFVQDQDNKGKEQQQND